MLKNTPFLKTMANLMCILSGLAIIGDILIFVAMASPEWDSLIASTGLFLTTSSMVISVIGVVCALISAIFALRRKNAGAAFWLGMIYLVINVYSVIMNWVSSGFYWNSLVGIAFPILYMLALYQAKE